MMSFASIFLDFNLPNATTWFYFSLLLGVALFFKFSRFLSIRNWDVVTLFLLVPGLLLLQEAHTLGGESLRRGGYLWLLSGSGYFLVRSLLDLTLVRRPALGPNLNLAGLAWLGGALFVSLVAVAIRPPSIHPGAEGTVPTPIKQVQEQVQQQGEKLFKPEKTSTETNHGEVIIWVERTLALMCHLAVVAGLIVVGCRHFQDTHGGMAAATFYLLLPYVFILLPYTAINFGQWQWSQVLPMAFLVWAVAAYRLPLVAGFLVGLAAGSVYFPALLFPVWISFYWRRGAGRFVGAFLLAAGLSLAITIWTDGHLASSVQAALNLADWQAWKQPKTESLWTDVHWAYRLPIFIAYLAFVMTTAFWPAPKNLAHLLALSTALLIGIQFWYADRGGIYVLWYLPFLLLLVFRPNLTDRVPPPILPESDWLVGFGQLLKRISLRLLKLPTSPVHVS